MNKILILCLLITMTACASGQDEKQPESTPQKAKTKARQLPQTPAKEAVKPSTPRRNNYTTVNSRRAEDINSKYPYDIELKTVDGKVIKSSEILADNGKPTVLLFWLTTCAPCRYELKAIQEKYENWQEEADFNLYAISTDFEKNYENFVKRVKESGWKWEAYNDVNREFRQILPGQLNGLPQTFILDKSGKIAYHKRKYRSGDEDILFAKVKELAMK